MSSDSGEEEELDELFETLEETIQKIRQETSGGREGRRSPEKPSRGTRLMDTRILNVPRELENVSLSEVTLEDLTRTLGGDGPGDVAQWIIACGGSSCAAINN